MAPGTLGRRLMIVICFQTWIKAGAEMSTTLHLVVKNFVGVFVYEKWLKSWKVAEVGCSLTAAFAEELLAEAIIKYIHYHNSSSKNYNDSQIKFKKNSWKEIGPFCACNGQCGDTSGSLWLRWQRECTSQLFLLSVLCCVVRWGAGDLSQLYFWVVKEYFETSIQHVLHKGSWLRGLRGWSIHP